MPWCDDCDRFLNPNSVHDDGTCPSCGTKIISKSSLQRARKGDGTSAETLATSGNETDEHPPTPWHFKVLVIALVLYLGWRLIQGSFWVAHHI